MGRAAGRNNLDIPVLLLTAATRPVIVRRMSDEQRYELGLGIELPTGVDIHGTAAGLDYVMSADLIDGAYVCTRLEVEPAASNPSYPITSEVLREFPVQRLLTDGVRSGQVVRHIRNRAAKAMGGMKGGPTDDLLQVVATAYRYGYAIGQSPTRFVMDVCGPIQRSRASRWISMARDRGYLGQTVERFAGGVEQTAPAFTQSAEATAVDPGEED